MPSIVPQAMSLAVAILNFKGLPLQRCARLGEEPVGSQRAGANLTWWTIGQLDADDQYLIGGINADVSFFNKRVPGRSWNQANFREGENNVVQPSENITPRVGDEPIVARLYYCGNSTASDCQESGTSDIIAATKSSGFLQWGNTKWPLATFGICGKVNLGNNDDDATGLPKWAQWTTDKLKWPAFAQWKCDDSDGDETHCPPSNGFFVTSPVQNAAQLASPQAI